MKHQTWKFLVISTVRSLTVLTVILALFAVMGPQTALAASITVNTTADENGAGANCSLREAITAANTNTAFGGCVAGTVGADTITLPAGTYQLTLANAFGVNEDGNATGDLDVLDSLTIQGAGSGTTIIEAGTTTSNGIDKVLALNPLCASPINVTIDGVTVRFGRNAQPSGAPDFSFTGGGIDWCSAGSGGTFTLSNSVVSDNTNVNGYGGGLNVDTVSSPTTVNITNVTFSNNQTLSTTQTANGGAINLFGDSPTINITNSTFTGNHTTNPTSGGGAIYFRPTTVGHLSISGSAFTNNTAAGIGGAIATDAHGAGTTVSIGTSSFTGNTATNSFGGALDLDATNVNTTPFSLTHLKITGNTAGISGGGVYVGNSNVTMSQSLIVGNSAPTGKGIRKSVDATTATVTNNWWGCSTGPGASPCDTTSTAGGALSFTPWYRNQLTAVTSPVATNQPTSLTASLLTNSANSAVPLADLAEIIGRGVTWAATNGNLSGTQGTIQAAGTATGSFQATSAGTAIISAKVDNDNTAPVSSNVLSLTVNKANTTAAITNGTTLSSTPSVTGQPVVVNFSVTGAFGNSPTAPTGDVTVTDGTDSCTGSVAAGTCSIAFTSIGSKTITATYSGDANFNTSPASTSASHTVNKADTTTAITSDTPDPSVVGQAVPVKYSVTVTSPGGGTPTGNVTVSDGIISCSGSVTAGQCSLTFTNTGAKSLTATYAGDSNYNGSASTAEAHQVNKADTTTTITSDNPDPSNTGQAVAVFYTVAANAPGAGTPTGNVTVSDGVDSCTGTAASSTCSISLTTPGARTLTATYAGDSNFNGSTSGGEPHTVNGQATTTAITSDDPDPSVIGQAVTVKYSVTPAVSGTPTGNVTVSDGTISCTNTVAGGQCSLTFTSLGAKSLTATYAGDSNFNSSTSAAEPHSVQMASPTITTVAGGSVVLGNGVKLSDSAILSSGYNPTGTITFTLNDPNNTAVYVDVVTVNGNGSYTTATGNSPGGYLPTVVGIYTWHATYSGDIYNNGATDNGQNESQTVNGSATTTLITADSPDPSVVGQAVTIQYSVTSGNGTPTGNVTVSDGTVSCTGAVSAGQCLLTFTSAGAKSLTATYAGDSNFSGSTSAAEAHQVNKTDTTTTITSDSPDPSQSGQAVTVNFTVAAVAPGAGTPTGNVTVSDGVNSCTDTVAAGTCNITLTTSGVRTLTATYAGDSNFNGSTSAGVSHTVGLTTTTTISSDNPDPSIVGQAVTVKYSVVPTSGSGTPTGNVTVSDGTISCTGTVAAGQCSLAFTIVGTKSLTATYAGDGSFNASTSSAETHTVNAAPTSLLYNGPQIVILGNSFKPAALLSNPFAPCVSSQTISFSLDRNPTTGTVGSYALGTATTNSSGQATMTAISTSGWQEGIYTINSSFAGTLSCLPASYDATLTAAGQGDSANGGGWYTLSGSGRINFGFTVSKTDNTCTVNCTYNGQVLLINNGKWRIKGTLNSYVKTATRTGAASGAGDLFWWDQSLNGGLGDWALAKSGVSFTINFYDSGKTGKKSTDSFDINIQYTPVSPQPSNLPNSNTLQVLKGGDIKVK